MAVAVVTRHEWQARALELASAHHLSGTARLDHTGKSGEVYRVPSHDRTRTYDVLTRHDGTIACPCKAGSFGRPCGHAGAVIYYRHQRAKATTKRNGDMTWFWFLQTGEW